MGHRERARVTRRQREVLEREHERLRGLLRGALGFHKVGARAERVTVAPITPPPVEPA